MDERAEQTLRRVREALEKGDVAGVPEVVRLIQELSAKAFSITIKELAEIISRDVSVTAKVISAANTVGYNPWAIPISTVSQAIQTIGFERVRNLAISLLLAENAERTKSEEQRESAALALHSGFLAQELAQEAGNREINPEQAFICASLRNYGRLIMTTFLLEDYLEAKHLQAEMGADEAFHAVLGLTPLELGYNLLLSRNLPEEILNSLQEYPRDKIDRTAKKDGNLAYLAIADFCVTLSELSIDPEVDPDEFEKRANALAGRYAKIIPANVPIGDLLRKAEGQMKTLQRGLSIRSLSSHVFESLSRRLEGEPIPQRPKVTRTKGGDTPTELLSATMQVEEKVEPEPAKEEKTEILQAIDELARRMEDRTITFPKAIYILLHSVHSQLGSQDSILFLRDRKRNGFVPRLGFGALFDKIKESEFLDPQKRDVFGISLNRHEDVYVANAADKKIARYLPPWLPLRSFLILPIRDNGGTYGMILSGTRASAPVPVTSQVLTHLRALRTHVSTIKNLELANAKSSGSGSA